MATYPEPLSAEQLAALSDAEKRARYVRFMCAAIAWQRDHGKNG
jgi:hypothetical protein